MRQIPSKREQVRRVFDLKSLELPTARYTRWDAGLIQEFNSGYSSSNLRPAMWPAGIALSTQPRSLILPHAMFTRLSLSSSHLLRCCLSCDDRAAECYPFIHFKVLYRLYGTRRRSLFPPPTHAPLPSPMLEMPDGKD